MRCHTHLQTDEIARPNSPFSADHSASSAGLTLSKNVIRLLMQRRARFQGANQKAAYQPGKALVWQGPFLTDA